MKHLACCIVAVLLAFPAGGSAQTHIVVKKSVEKIPVDLSQLRASGSGASEMLQVLEADLKRWGWFSVAPAGSGAVALSGTCTAAGGQLVLQCRATRRDDKRIVLTKRYAEPTTQARMMAHRLADDLLHAVTGRRGIAATRIAMIGTQSGGKELYICDSDGANLRQLTRDRTVSLAPTWGPNGKQLAYTSFRSGFPDVYLVTLQTGVRERLAKFPGLNAGAAIAPDGREMALTLSKDGNPELYLMGMDGSGLRRLTRTRAAAETSPSFSPDGRRIVFVSDSSGSPQLYIMGRSGGSRRRISFQGRENVSPDWGPDDRIVFSSRRYGKYQLCVMNPDQRHDTQMTSELVDHEDPCWAPDGRHVVYTRTEGYRSSLYVLDTVSGASIRLLSYAGDWYTPAWSP